MEVFKKFKNFMSFSQIKIINSMFSSCLIICKDSNYSYKINLKDIYNITRVGTFFD